MANKFRNAANCIPVNWGEVLGRGVDMVYPSDIDGVLERMGNFLILEWKHESVEEMPTGQHLMYSRLAELPEFKVLYLFGCYQTWKIKRMQLLGSQRGMVNADNQILLTYMRNWWLWANANPRHKKPRE